MAEVDRKAGELCLRPAKAEDILLLFCWANDPVVRQNAFCTEEIAFAEHRKWFERALREECVRIYILQRGDLPVGQARVEYDGMAWRIDYSVDAAWRGNGYGRQLLRLLEAAVPAGACLLGEVRSENTASKKVFEELGYEKYMNTEKDISEYRKYIRGGWTHFHITRTDELICWLYHGDSRLGRAA